MEREEYQDTEIGRIPRDWKVVRLGEVAFVRYGKANPKTPGNVPVIGSGGIYDFTESALVSFRTIVIGRKGSAGEAVLMNEPCWPSDTTFYLEWKSQISPAWVFYWLTLRKPSPEGTTATLPSLRREDLESHVIPLPPLEEQKRIVARIEELMGRVREARRLREEAKQEAERLWQAVLAQTFPRPGSELPAGWRWVRLGEVFRLKNGKFIRVSDLTSQGKVPVYGSNGLLGFTSVPLVEKGRTIVIGRVGACGAINVVDAPCWISDNAMFVAEWFTDCEIEYVALALYNMELSSFAKKGAQPSISQEVVYNTLIAFPLLEEQRRIVAYLQEVQEKIKALKDAQAQTEAELKRLEQAILEKAFRGEL